jgi:hypothetical protein
MRRRFELLLLRAHQCVGGIRAPSKVTLPLYVIGNS